MDSILNLIANSPNLQLPLLAVLGFCGYVLMRSQMREMKHSLSKQIDDLRHTDLVAIHKRIDGVDKRIDGVEVSIKELKSNDLAHLNNTIEALTFTLEKNGFLQKEDKEYVDRRLSH